MSKEYDCYGYFAIGSLHNTYPIRDVERHLEKVLSLKKGDVLNLRGIGDLQVMKLHVDEYTYRDEGKDYLYQEIGVACIKI